MKEKEGKEKPIKPKPFEKVIRTYAPARVWPDVPEDVRKEYRWYHVLRDWLCEIVPGGNVEEYCKVVFLGPVREPGTIEEVQVTLYSHTFRYVIRATEQKLWVGALRRTPYAGTEGEESYAGDDLFDGRFSTLDWEYAKNQILRYEFVRVFKEVRTGERWKFFRSTYSLKDGTRQTSYWDQPFRTPKEEADREAEGRSDECRHHVVVEEVK